MIKKKFCKHKHNISIVGRDKRGSCNECIKIHHNSIGYKKYRKEFAVKHWKENKVQLSLKHKIYYGNNKEHIFELDKRSTKRRLITDPNFKIIKNLRGRFNQALKKNYKSGSAVKDLGCSIEMFKYYVEKKFYSNMSWDNWGSVWELDHIVPLKNFNLTDRKQLLKACNYKNLQPLTIEDHKKKTTKDNLK